MTKTKQYQLITAVLIMIILTAVFYFIQSIEPNYAALHWQLIAHFFFLALSAGISRVIRNKGL